MYCTCVDEVLVDSKNFVPTKVLLVSKSEVWHNWIMEVSNVNWNLYKSFKAVYQTKNLTHASRVLKTTPQAVGQNIKELSRQLGVTLFVATTRGVEPTNDANKLYSVISGAVETLVSAEQIFDNQNIVRMIVNSSAAEHYIREYMKLFCEKNPGIQFEFLRQGDADFIIDLDSAFDGKYKKVALFAEAGVLVATREFLGRHGLVESMTKEELLKLPIIIREGRLPYFREHITDKINLMKATTTEATLSMAKSSLGVGLLSDRVFEIAGEEDLVILNVEGVRFRAGQFVCGYVGLSKPAKMFVDGLVKFIKGEGRNGAGS